MTTGRPLRVAILHPGLGGALPAIAKMAAGVSAILRDRNRPDVALRDVIRIARPRRPPGRGGSGARQ